MAHTLPQRMESYEESFNTKIISRIPIIIKIDGRSFSRVTKNITKPYCHSTMTIMANTMLNLVKQIDGAVFGYQYSDKIILVLKNDRSDNEDPWFGNQIQLMCSVASSMATSFFLTLMWGIENPPELEGDISFKCHVFGVPSIIEAANYILYHQFCCVNQAITEVLYTVVGQKNVSGMTYESRKQLLDNAGVSVDDYPNAFRYGVASYVAPKLIRSGGVEHTQHKWQLDFDVPVFSDKKSREHLITILDTGTDIFRPERDML